MKKLISLILLAALVLSLSTPAFATKKFDTSVFDGRDDISVFYDDMTTTTKVYALSTLSGNSSINFNPVGIILVTPSMGTIDLSNDSLDLFTFQFEYFGRNWVNLNEIIIKIGNNRYRFFDCDTSYSAEFDGLVHERISFSLKSEFLPFIDDFIKNQDKEIRVRLYSDVQTFEFLLTDDMKNSISLLYNLFISGGGTRKSNMDIISEIDPATMIVLSVP